MASGDNEKTGPKRYPQHSSILIRKLVELMDHPISENITQRHLHILKQFLNALHCGFWLQDTPYIIRLFEFIVKKLDQTPEFKYPLECLLYFTARFPLRTKASDEFVYARDFQEYFSILGYLVLCLHEYTDLQKLTINAIKSLLTSKSPAGNCCVSIEYCQEMAEKSRLPAILAQILHVISNDLYPLLLDLVFSVCQLSTAACQKMLQEDAVEYLLQRIIIESWKTRYPNVKPKNPSPTDNMPILEDTCCVLWKLLNAINWEKVNVNAPSEFALWNLEYAFRWCTVCPGQRLNRNNLIAIILKIFMIFHETDFSHTKLFKDIIVITSATGGCSCMSSLKFGEDELDFQFKKIIWSCYHFVQMDPNNVANTKELIKIFTGVLCAQPTTGKNHMEQYGELAKMVLKIIPKLMKTSLEFDDISAALKKIHSMIEEYVRQEYDLEFLEAGIYCFGHLLCIKGVPVTMKAYETVRIILDLGHKILQAKTLTSIHQRILAHAFYILQTLCQTKHVSNRDVVNLITDFLQRVLHPPDDDPLIDVRVIICAIYSLWGCIILNRHYYRQFLKRGGIYTLLDITEAYTFPVKSISLGMLADVAQKSSCVPYLITWRKRGKKLVPLLLDIFRNRTEKECGAVKNTELIERKSENVWSSLCQPQKIYFQGDCIVKSQLLKICRYRIHGILYALKVKFKERVEIANERYKLFNDKLTAEDEMTLLFAKNLLALLLCQSWLDVSKELEASKIIPVDADNDHLKKRIQEIRQWRLHLRRTIDLIVREEKQQEQARELHTYVTLKEARLADALDALSELRYISNCTERMFQMRQKLILQKDIAMSRRSIAYTNFHKTISDLPFAVTCNQYISIQSNIIYEKKEEECPIAPVSIGDDEPPASLDSDDGLSSPNLEC